LTFCWGGNENGLNKPGEVKRIGFVVREVMLYKITRKCNVTKNDQVMGIEKTQ
jgi:hypothetical protein